jgi:DNA-binding CsgD family transcriptional regulator
MTTLLFHTLQAAGVCHEKSWQAELSAREAATGTPFPKAKFWREVLAGRWSVHGNYSHEGRCYFLLSVNAASTARLRALRPRELEVWLQEAAGGSNKGIAAALGISQSAVTQTLRRARAKLGARASLELLRSLIPLPWVRRRCGDGGAIRR